MTWCNRGEFIEEGNRELKARLSQNAITYIKYLKGDNEVQKPDTERNSNRRQVPVQRAPV
jgi:hypothetical protein